MNRIILTILILLSLALSLTDLGKRAFMDYDEASYATVYHESSVRNNFLTFTYLDKPWLSHPPLYFWLARSCAMVFGENEFSLRLPGAIFITVSVLLVFLIVLELTKDWTAALLSMVILLTTAFFVFAGRQLRLDIPVISAILLSFYGFIKMREKHFWFLIFGLGIALGILLKSVVGLLIYPIIVLYSLIYKDFRWIKNKWFWISNILAFVVIMPWHIYQTLIFGEKFWSEYIGRQVITLVTDTVVLGKKDPFFYQFQQLFIVNQPWFSSFFILAVIFLTTAKSKFKNYKFELFTLIATVSVLIIFYIPQTRILYYFIPMLPFIAMFIGSYGAKLLKKHRQITLALIAFLVIVGFANTFLKIFSDKDRGFFLQPSKRMSRYTIANDEKIIAEYAAKEKITLYLYNWQFFQTLIYYSQINGGANIEKLTKKSTLTPPYMLFVPSQFFNDSLDAEKEGAEILFRGEAGTLVKIYPEK